MEATEALGEDLTEYLSQGDDFPAFVDDDNGENDDDSLNCGDFCVGKFSEDGCW